MLDEAAMLGVKFMGNLFGGLNARQQAKANNRLIGAQNEINKAETYASNLVREANNELSAVVGSLNRARQAMNNRQVLRTNAREQEAIQTNLSRVISDLTQTSLEGRLDSAFELGSLAASASAAGVGGNSREVMSATLRMTAARRDQAIQSQKDTASYDALKMLTNTQADAYASLDNTVILDQLDLSRDTYIPQFIQKAPSVLRTTLTAAAATAAQNPGLTQSVLGGSSGSTPQASGGNRNFMSSVQLRI